MARLRSGKKAEEVDDLNAETRKQTSKSSSSIGGTLLRLLYRCIVNTIIVVVCIYLASPFISLLFPGAVTQVIFLNLFGKRWFSDDLSYPESSVYNLSGARNLYIESTDDVRLGVWQVLPQSVQASSSSRDSSFYDKALADGKPIVVYFHGNAGTRGFGHRVRLYKLLSDLDYHIVTVDYRGFADSEGWPYPEGIFSDAQATIDWVKSRSNTSPLYIWGHSMGSGVASRLSKRLCDKGACPAGVILETPFNSLQDAFMNHPFAIPFWVMPGYLWLHAYAMNDTIQQFHSDQCMSSITCPLLILHAEDDSVVPFHLGHRLYKVAKEVRPKTAAPVEFVNFGKHGYGHKCICDAPELPEIIRKFIV